MLVPTILFYVVLSQIFVCDAIAISNSIWSKVDHVSTIETDISSIRCSSHGYLMNSVKLTFKFLCMKSNHIKFHLSGCIKILILNTISSWLLGNISIPTIRVYLRHLSWIYGHFSLISPFISDNGCETHLSGKIITRMTAQETSLSPESLESHLKFGSDLSRALKFGSDLSRLVALLSLLLCLLLMFIWFMIISLILFTWICSLSSWNISSVNMYAINILVLNDDNRPELIPCHMIFRIVQNRNVYFLHYIVYLGAPNLDTIAHVNKWERHRYSWFVLLLHTKKMYINIKSVWLPVMDNVG
jgi:hypothetical protein